MAFYVYIIRSDIDGSYYKGFSKNPSARIAQHNCGGSRYTSGKMPWQLIYIELLQNKKDALVRERALKKYSHEQISKLVLSNRNIVDQFKT